MKYEIKQYILITEKALNGVNPSYVQKKMVLMVTKSKDYLTTGQAATLFSVDSDTVLRWIKTGKIPAYRTPGGHYRIHRSVFLTRIAEESCFISNKNFRQPFPYCWEFNGKKNCDIDDCKNCLVYKTHAKYCYEMVHFPSELGHLKRYCASSCQSCEYYNIINKSN